MTPLLYFFLVMATPEFRFGKQWNHKFIKLFNGEHSNTSKVLIDAYVQYPRSDKGCYIYNPKPTISNYREQIKKNGKIISKLVHVHVHVPFHSIHFTRRYFTWNWWYTLLPPSEIIVSFLRFTISNLMHMRAFNLSQRLIIIAV
jgi:hypothetical protein